MSTCLIIMSFIITLKKISFQFDVDVMKYHPDFDQWLAGIYAEDV